MIWYRRLWDTPHPNASLQLNNPGACAQMVSTATLQSLKEAFILSANQEIHYKCNTFQKSFSDLVQSLASQQQIKAKALPGNAPKISWWVVQHCKQLLLCGESAVGQKRLQILESDYKHGNKDRRQSQTGWVLATVLFYRQNVNGLPSK